MKCIVWGAGKTGRRFLCNKSDDIQIVAIVDNDSKKWGCNWVGNNYKIENPEGIKTKQFDYIIICAVLWEEIEMQLISSMKVQPQKILYDESIYNYTYNEFYDNEIWKIYREEHAEEVLDRIVRVQYKYNKFKYSDRLRATHNLLIRITGKDYNNPPITLNDKIRYLEMEKYGNLERNCADKYEVRKYVNYCGLGDILPKLYFAVDNEDELNYEKFPDSFAFKQNNGCGFNFICKDKNEISIEILKGIANKWKNRKIQYIADEWHYDGIKRKLICEELLGEQSDGPIPDYKYFCCNGKIACILVCVERNMATLNSYHYYFDRNWNSLDYAAESVRQYPPQVVSRPQNLEEMNRIAERLSNVFPFVRVDLYNINGKIYFGELTFTPCGGAITIQSEEAQIEIGKLIDINYKDGQNEEIYKAIY